MFSESCFEHSVISGSTIKQKTYIPQYTGTWYQIQRYPQVHENPDSTCVGARYTINSEGDWVDVTNWEVIDGTLETIDGTATVSSTDGSAKLAVVLPVAGTNRKIFGNNQNCLITMLQRIFYSSIQEFLDIAD